MKKPDLINLLKFTEFTNRFATVQRKTIMNKDYTFENDAQHSFQTAIIAWYICSAQHLTLNLEKLLKYALVHDLVEAYSGNFPAYSRTSDSQSIKTSSEKQAFKQIRTEFKEVPELLDALGRYMALEDEESCFIYALDKFLPLLNIELNNNDFYFRTQTTKEQMLLVKKDKIAKHKIISQYFDLLLDYFAEDVKFFWPECNVRDYSNKTYSFGETHAK